jgi:hypothetical protein
VTNTTLLVNVSSTNGEKEIKKAPWCQKSSLVSSNDSQGLKALKKS